MPNLPLVKVFIQYWEPILPGNAVQDVESLPPFRDDPINPSSTIANHEGLVDNPSTNINFNEAVETSIQFQSPQPSNDSIAATEEPPLSAPPIEDPTNTAEATPEFNDTSIFTPFTTSVRRRLPINTPATAREILPPSLSTRGIKRTFFEIDSDHDTSAASSPMMHKKDEAKRYRRDYEIALLEEENKNLTAQLQQNIAKQEELQHALSEMKEAEEKLRAALTEQKDDLEKREKQLAALQDVITEKNVRDSWGTAWSKAAKRLNVILGSTLPTNNNDRASVIAESVAIVLRMMMHKKWDTTIFKVLLDTVFECKIFSGPLWENCLLIRCRKKGREEIFLPWRVQRPIDMSGAGTLNYGGLEVLNEMDPLPRFSQKCIPSPATIRKVARALEEYAQTLLPFEYTLTDYGPLYYFKFEPLLRHLLKTSSLEEYARADGTGEPVVLGATLNGAKLTNNIQHLLGGFKLCDERAKDPLTNTPLFLNGKNFQSRENCFPAIMLLSKDTKEVMSQ